MFSFMALALFFHLLYAPAVHYGKVSTTTRNSNCLADTATLGGQWFLQPILASDTAAGKIPVLVINLAAGTFSGNTGCNTMRGSIQKTDSSLLFNKDMVTTKMICAGYNEAAFISNLQRTNRYRFDNGVLVLLFDVTELSRWTRKPDRKMKMNKA